MNRNHWTRRRPVDRPSKTAKYDHDNSIAASIILSSPEQHSQFQLDWARRFQRRYDSQNKPAGLLKKNS